MQLLLSPLNQLVYDSHERLCCICECKICSNEQHQKSWLTFSCSAQRLFRLPVTDFKLSVLRLAYMRRRSEICRYFGHGSFWLQLL